MTWTTFTLYVGLYNCIRVWYLLHSHNA